MDISLADARVAIPNIEIGRGDASIAQGGEQIRFVGDLGPRNVDQDGGWPHLCERRRVDQPAGPLRERTGEDEIIYLWQGAMQIVDRNRLIRFLEPRAAARDGDHAQS